MRTFYLIEWEDVATEEADEVDEEPDDPPEPSIRKPFSLWRKHRNF